jgi:hypothetical protein
MGGVDMNPLILNTLTELCDPENPRLATIDYCQREGIDVNSVCGCGAVTVAQVVLLPCWRFDLPDGHGAESVPACIIEARAGDGETIIDLVAWPVSDPTDVRTLLGRASMVGLWAALNPETYYLDFPLLMHRTPLDWLRADCNGAAVVIPELTAATFLQIAGMGGRIAAQDFAHGRELRSYLSSMINRVEIVSPQTALRAA